ncbi:hypothetical protein JG687_00010265 [Phytophthora cactorum]|uniref:Armadillo-type fold n=1 Tax=Phytophthora cactorum TaxID=29920 RepID=A0A8T1U912_9STRA|nr:hypothetical protein JG687_00010265 [Phytophthora cactorum]
MESDVVAVWLDSLVLKLRHPLTKIRSRALHTLLFKLRERLVRWQELEPLQSSLIPSLLACLVPPLELDTLHVLELLVQSQSEVFLAGLQHFGAAQKLQQAANKNPELQTSYEKLLRQIYVTKLVSVEDENRELVGNSQEEEEAEVEQFSANRVLTDRRRAPRVDLLEARGWRFAQVTLTSVDDQYLFEFEVKLQLRTESRDIVAASALSDLPEKGGVNPADTSVQELDKLRLEHILDILSGICRPVSLEQAGNTMVDNELELTHCMTWKLVELVLQLLRLYPSSQYIVEEALKKDTSGGDCPKPDRSGGIIIPRLLWEAVKLWVAHPLFPEVAAQEWKDESLIQGLSSIDPTIPAFVELKHSSQQDARLILAFVDFAKTHREQLADFGPREVPAILNLEVAQKTIQTRYAFDDMDTEIIADATLQAIWSALTSDTENDNGRLTEREQLRALVVVKRKVLPLLKRSQSKAFSLEVARLLLNVSESKVSDLFLSLAADTDIISTICTKYSAVYATEPVLHGLMLEVLLRFARGMGENVGPRLSEASREKICKRLLEMLSPLLTVVCRHRVPGSFSERDVFAVGSQCMVAILTTLPRESLLASDSPLEHTDSSILLDGGWASRFLFDHVAPIRELGFRVIEHAAASNPSSRLLEMAFETSRDDTESDAVRAAACSALTQEIVRYHERPPDRQAALIKMCHGTAFARKALRSLSGALKGNKLLARTASAFARLVRVLYIQKDGLASHFGDMQEELEAAEEEYDVYPLLIQVLSLREWKDNILLVQAFDQHNDYDSEQFGAPTTPGFGADFVDTVAKLLAPEHPIDFRVSFSRIVPATHMEVVSSMIGGDKESQQLAKNEGLLNVIMSNWNVMKTAHVRGSQLMLRALHLLANYIYGNDSARSSMLISPAPGSGRASGGDYAQTLLSLLFNLASTRGDVTSPHSRVTNDSTEADIALSNAACQVLKAALLHPECVQASVKSGSISRLVDSLQDRLKQARQTNKTNHLENSNLAQMLGVLSSIASTEEGARVLYSSLATVLCLVFDDVMHLSDKGIRRSGCLFLRNLSLSQATKNNFAVWEELLDEMVTFCKARALLLSKPTTLQSLKQVLDSQTSGTLASASSSDIAENLRRVLMLVQE